MSSRKWELTGATLRRSGSGGGTRGWGELGFLGDGVQIVQIARLEPVWRARVFGTRSYVALGGFSCLSPNFLISFCVMNEKGFSTAPDTWLCFIKWKFLKVSGGN